MSYTSVAIIADGAVWIDADVATEEELQGVIAEAQASLEPGQTAEVFVIDHPHPQSSEECSCVQYQTDHSPLKTLRG